MSIGCYTTCTNCSIPLDSTGTLVTYSRQPKRITMSNHPNPDEWLQSAQAALDMTTQRLERDKVRLERPGRGPIRTKGLLPARNQTCPCGSGRKFKRCHGGPKTGETNVS